MLKLHENEKIIRKVHRHWIVVAEKAFMFIFLLIIPLAGLMFLSSMELESDFIMPFAFYVLSLYIFVLSVLAFISWVDYWLDMWIITNERIIDIEQHGLFRHEISEFGLDKVQDVTVDVPGFLATFLKYGKIAVHTAGERVFEANDLPNVHEVKDLILKCCKEARMNNHKNGIA